ncbi:MAG: histidine kinase dimerization/phospho-acceptor domain-containing protein [Oscillospiraceae bacterium]
MNRINNVTNDFVSSVSHEFKTPLTAIEGYAMLLQDTGLTAERDEYLDKILYNTHASHARRQHPHAQSSNVAFRPAYVPPR